MRLRAGALGAALLATACSATEPAAEPAAAPGPTTQASAPPSVPAGGLLPPVSAYVRAVNAKDLDGVAKAFAPNAELVDVGRGFRGREAIRGWAEREVIGGTLTVSRVVENRTGYQKLLVRFAPGGTGGFAAHYAFTVDGAAITRADLTYAN
ncbi:nuclear transport factor 2 family protein [Spirillospora sp. NPDC050679]